MLDSLVRVTRRVGWVTDLLAANHRPTTGLARPPRTPVREPRARPVRKQKLLESPCRDSPAPCWSRRGSPRGLCDTTVGSRAIAGPAITQTTPTRSAPATFRSSDLQAVSQPVAASFGREANASRDLHEPPGRSLREPRPDAHLKTSRLNPPATGFRGPTRLPLSSFTYS